MSEQCCSNSDNHENKTCSCGCGSSHDGGEGHCNCAEKFLEIADEAWVEVLKDKIKSKIIAHKGEDMDKLAEIIAKANGKKWCNIIASKTNCREFKEHLKDFFTKD